MPDPLICTTFLVAAFVLAGAAHLWWMHWPRSRRLAVPLDCGRRIRGRRILGDHKTLRGFAVLVPATAVAFLALCLLLGEERSPWSLSAPSYALLGCWAGFAFMAAELPNSFLKRQLDIAPGSTPAHPWGRAATLVGDHLDSVLGMLLALALFVPVPAATWLTLAVLGPLVHLGFSAALCALGVKARPA